MNLQRIATTLGASFGLSAFWLPSVSAALGLLPTLLTILACAVLSWYTHCNFNRLATRESLNKFTDYLRVLNISKWGNLLMAAFFIADIVLCKLIFAKFIAQFVKQNEGENATSLFQSLLVLSAGLFCLPFAILKQLKEKQQFQRVRAFILSVLFVCLVSTKDRSQPQQIQKISEISSFSLLDCIQGIALIAFGFFYHPHLQYQTTKQDIEILDQQSLVLNAGLALSFIAITALKTTLYNLKGTYLSMVLELLVGLSMLLRLPSIYIAARKQLHSSNLLKAQNFIAYSVGIVLVSSVISWKVWSLTAMMQITGALALVVVVAGPLCAKKIKKGRLEAVDYVIFIFVAVIALGVLLRPFVN